MRTSVVNLRSEPFDVGIGRPSKWSNPFVIGVHGDRDQVCDMYEKWIVNQPDLMAALHELKGKTLGCYCKPRRCHGDTLARLADDS